MYPFGQDESINKFLSNECLITYFNPEFERPIVRVWIGKIEDCPDGVRRLTVEEARALQGAIIPHIQYNTNLAGGSICVSGHQKTIEEGMFETNGCGGNKGWGYVLVTEAGINDYDKNPLKEINSLSEIPPQWRRMTIEETRFKRNDKWKSVIGTWDIKQVAGGRVYGGGYHYKQEEGYFDQETHKVILVTDQLPPST